MGSRASRPVDAMSGQPSDPPAEAAVTTTCPACRSQLRVKAELAGKKLRCPQCRAVVAVPGGPARAGRRALWVVAVLVGMAAAAGGFALWVRGPREQAPPPEPRPSRLEAAAEAVR